VREPRTSCLLASDRARVEVIPDRVVLLDRPRRGAVAVRAPAGGARRAEAGSCGPLILEARPAAAGVTVEVWGPAATPPAEIDAAVGAAHAWIGLDDDPPADFGALVAGHPALRGFHRRLGTPRLSRMPRVGEAVGRAIIGQLVQRVEAHRSTAQVAARLGDPAPAGLWAWPRPAVLGATPAWALRRCGISLRGATALHATAIADARLAALVDWATMDRCLRSLPGVGVWTSGEARRDLGDPDAVPVGDANLPDTVGAVLAGGSGDGPDGGWTDAAMLELLAPYAGQRGRVLRLLGRGLASGLARRPPRRAPRAAVSAHRYW
jgi:3-methyladenine DNA glycosylase/8-oxoguanine DNA glycosylase